MKTTIHVTQRHIDNGNGESPDGCALAIAINEQVPTCEAQVVGGRIGAILRPLLGADAVRVDTPDDANRFVVAFDIFKRSGHVAPQLKPFKFEIDVPNDLLSAEPVRTHEQPRVESTVASSVPEITEVR